jgi:hypothetical protein
MPKSAKEIIERRSICPPYGILESEFEEPKIKLGILRSFPAVFAIFLLSAMDE